MEFKDRARELLPRVQGTVGPKDEDLRKALLKFIGDFANWDLSSDRTYLEVSRGLVKAAYPQETPLVVDPFAGGGSIPLEALRLGCETFASDLNPVACLILKVMLEDIPRHGPELADELRRVGKEIKEKAEKELAEFYPKDQDGATPLAYLWARTVRCESPNCGAEIPLMRSFWLCKKANRKRALRYKIVRPKGEPPRAEFGIFEPKTEKEVPGGTVTRAKAICLCCNMVLPPQRVRAQLTEQRGGADVIFDEKGNRIGGARMTAVVTLHPGIQGRHYRLPTKRDYEAVWRAQKHVKEILDEWDLGGREGLCPVPNEPTPAGGGSGAGRAFSVQKYGMMAFGDLFTARQKVALLSFGNLVKASRKTALVGELLALNLSHISERNTSLCRWYPDAYMETVSTIYGRQALPIVWDFAEAIPLMESSGGWSHSLKIMCTAVETAVSSRNASGQVQIADACKSPFVSEGGAVWFTDPPYYDAVPYADLSDFFYVWLKRTLPTQSLLHDPFEARNLLTPKGREIVQDETKMVEGRPKDRVFFEQAMGKAFTEGRRVLKEDGIGCVVFAHKTTEGWEALLSGMIHGGWTITGSWPIATEMGSRLRARESAALATSVHLVCRPRVKEDVGDWEKVLRELPGRVREWMDRLEREGVRGADLVFACIGPALEIYSCFSKVVDTEEREIPLGGDPEAKEPYKRGFLTYIWEVVGRTALEQVLRTTHREAQDNVAAGLEEDARLTALFLWTLQSSNGEVTDSSGDDVEEASDENSEEETPKKKRGGFSLPFDVVRRFAQPLGIHLPDWESRIIETEKGVVRLLSVAERAKQLFGEEGADAVAETLERRPEGARQLQLFPQREQGAAPQIKGRGRGKRAGAKVSGEALRAKREATTLDRIHAAMLLQAGGKANALRALLKSEQDRGPDFLRLANALTALYPRGSEEKRLLDAMLLAVPR